MLYFLFSGAAKALGGGVYSDAILVRVLVLALHSLRKPNDPRSVIEYPDLVRRVKDTFSHSDLLELGELAQVTSSSEAALPFLRDVGVDVDAPQSASQQFIAWQINAQDHASHATRTTGWLIALLDAPLGERVYVLRRALWPSAESMLGEDPSIDSTPSGIRRARIARLGRGIRALPVSLSRLLRSRHSLRAARRKNVRR